jgi:hypothetical protein
MSLNQEKPLYISLKYGGPMYESNLRSVGIPVEQNPYRNTRSFLEPEKPPVLASAFKSPLATHLRQTVTAAVHNLSAILF